MNHQTQLSIRLKQLRTAHAYTQDYVASMLGIIRQAYSHYETGRCVPPTAALYQLAQLYHISVEELLRMAVLRTGMLYRMRRTPKRLPPPLSATSTATWNFTMTPSTARSIVFFQTKKKNCSTISAGSMKPTVRRSSNLRKSKQGSIECVAVPVPLAHSGPLYLSPWPTHFFVLLNEKISPAYVGRSNLR